MISEIANSLFLTYLASEYLVAAPSTSPQRSSRSSSRSRTIQHQGDVESSHNNKGGNTSNFTLIGALAILTGIANLVDHHYYISVVWDYITKVVAVPNVPSYVVVIPAKLFVAASSYVTALYLDIHRDRTNNSSNNKTKKQPKMPFRSVFLPKVGWAFLKILPAYPFLAVLISFVFLFVVDFWEYVLHLPLEWLNNPVYYGTLYGPFAYTYVHVKREVLRKAAYTYNEDHGSHQAKSSWDDTFV